MKSETIQASYHLFSFLLRYPTRDHLEAVDEITAFSESIEEESIRKTLVEFLSVISNWNQDQWVEHYIEVFDFGKTSNLYMTYLKLGEQKERGLELLKLKKFYEAAGFDVTDKELPDYLPLMLEFCAAIDQEVRIEFLSKHAAAIAETKSKLEKLESSYYLLLEALIKLMSYEGVVVSTDHSQKEERPLSLEDVRIMQSMREQLIQNQLG
ncbi:nitrate reductase molybdenum cofactor assembly chaperone [Gracilibacillus massiliensis]|uniref:nitrate reductase molybdenum cofactor assembly chaperone n=1 Tax=Gracilibacillus massiliensis TaxID=1564956 RepID=UPI00071E1572|nr:nitrate reductase molybdenum cofactor assembly chaperone [Gracilibacillus massiliensis]